MKNKNAAKRNTGAVRDIAEVRPAPNASGASRPAGSLDVAEVAREDVGNIFRLEHVNLRVPDQALATIFYVMGLGFTRDPHFILGPENMWVNIGETQFHLPTEPTAQVLRGHIGVIIADLDALRQRLGEVAPRLAGTRFAWSRKKDGVWVTCPWGNRFHCFEPGPRHPGIRYGLAAVQLGIPMGSAAAIGRFYQRILDAPVSVEKARGKSRAVVRIGGNQDLIYQETDAPIPPFDGHHIAVYVANMSKGFDWLLQRGLIMEGLARHQYRFQDIADPDTGQIVFRLEHEVRSFQHPMFLRPLVNRDPHFYNRIYASGARPIPTWQWGP